MKAKYLIPGIASAALLFSSCGKKEETSNTASTQDTATSADAAQDTPAEIDSAKDGLSPSETVEAWAKDMRAGRIANLWSALPEQYQTDVQGLAHDFGAKVDTEVYNETMKTLSATAGLLKNKKDIILEVAQENSEAMGEDKVAAIKENYDAVVNLVNAIVNSEIKDTESLQSMDIAKLLGNIQPQFQKVSDVVFTVVAEEEDISWMDDPKAELVSESGDSAEVKDPENQEETMKLKRVGDRWLPEEMVTGWDEQMEEARQGLAAMEAMDEVQKQQILGGLRMVQAVIADLDSAQSKDEFVQKLQTAGQQFGGMFGGGL